MDGRFIFHVRRLKAIGKYGRGWLTARSLQGGQNGPFGFQQIGVEFGCRGGRIASFKGRHERCVERDIGLVQVGAVFELAEDEAEFGKDEVEAGAEAGAVAEFHHGAVKFHVDRRDTLPVARLSGFLPLPCEPAHAHEGGMSHCRRLHRPLLDDGAHPVDVDHCRFVRCGDEDPAVGNVGQQALAGQQTEHLAQRVARNAEKRRNLLFGQFLARSEFAGDHPLANACRQRVGQRPVIVFHGRHGCSSLSASIVRENRRFILLNNLNSVIQQEQQFRQAKYDMMCIDLNSDLGESFGPWPMGDDGAMLSIVSSANIACGFHAGDPSGILSVLRQAARLGVSVGAHVGYRDLVGFGRRNMDPTSEELIGDTVYQIGALKGLATAAGTRVGYVKPHGALYNTIAHDRRQADAVIAGIKAVDPSLVLMALAGAPIVEWARAAGLSVVCEAFADRAYNADGSLVSRREAGSVLHDPALIAARMLRLVREGRITAIDGTDVALTAQSICVHGDTPAAVSIAQAVRDTLLSEGVVLKSFVDG